ncbi:inactive tyrosine-protein kinase PEAK1-like [Anneissia japonica]|uniref:inactive tyrosine-protein kinase PEAK1-like n=1 Tax=Anneissia japonica TaxID=1529436 RepID=UPI0014255CF5|nr:inactive tyrosine-protein kinase PEAK1-like [Anneissia japonica]
MKEEVKINNIPCKDYKQHQFKHNYCAKCLKPLAQHSISISRTLEPVNVKIIELQNGDNNDGESFDKPISNKYQDTLICSIDSDQQVNGSHKENGFSESNGFHVSSRTHKKSCNKNSRTPPQVKDKPVGSGLRRQNPVAKSTGSQILLKSNGESTPRSRRADSAPETESVSPTEKQHVRLTKSTNSICTDNTGLEFQRVAKSLKKVNNNFVIEENNIAQISTSTPSGKQDFPDGRVDSKDFVIVQDLKRKEELIAAKSDLPSQMLSNAAYSAFKIEKHDTLPRSIGSNHKRPSIGDLSERRDSDPEIYEPEQKVEEINVVLLSDSANPAKISQNKKVKSSQISSEIYFGMNVNQENRNNSTNNNHRPPLIRESSREITIISADGSVSRCTESPPLHLPSDNRVSTNSTLSNLSLHSSGSSFSTSSKVQPYRVVDLETHECAPYVVTDIPGTSDKDNRLSNNSDDSENGHKTVFQQKITLVDSTYTVKEHQFGRQASGNVPEYEEPAEQSPTLPKILHHEMSALPKSAKRNSDSSLYRVPIFIGSNIDAVNGSSQRSDGKVLPEPKSTDDQYLKPMRRFSTPSNDIDHNYDVVPESETDFSDMSKSTSSSGGESSGIKKKLRSRKSADIKMNQQKSDSRSRKRSVTHPTSSHASSSVQNSEQSFKKNIQFSDEDLENIKKTPVKMRQKRNAPPPPPESKSRRSLTMYNFTADEMMTFSDTMPKVPPPLPPHQNLERKMSQPVNIPKSNSRTVENNNKPTNKPRPTGSSSQAHPSSKSTTLPVNSKAPSSHDKLAERSTPEKNMDGKKRTAPLLNQRDRSLSPHRKETKDKAGDKEPVDPVHEVLASYSPPRNGSPLAQFTTTSPQRPVTLPVDAIEPVQPISRETKGKWSKLPWRKNRSRRKDGGSPEREFNAKGVSDWLINKHMTEEEIAAVSREESLQRLEVIKAYKGEPIPVIESCHIDYSTPTSEHGLSKFYVEAHRPVDSPPLPRLTSSLSKRKAPGPPDVIQSDQLLEEFKIRKKKTPAKLQKSHSFTSVSSIKSNCMENYENWGPVRNGLPAPKKPSRRFRNRTTAFENLPSQTDAHKKRIAPQIPRDAGVHREDSGMSSANQSSHDEADRPPSPPRRRSNSAVESNFPNPVMAVKTSTPLKSAMRNVEDNHSKVDEKIPKRPVRVLVPGHPSIASQNDTSQNNKEKLYANVDMVLSDNDATYNHTPVPAPRIKKLMVDQGTSPLKLETLLAESLSPPTSLDASVNVVDPFVAKITNRNMITLSKVASVWQNCHETCPRLDDVVFKDFKLTMEQPCFTSPEAKFFSAELNGSEEKNFTLMVFTDSELVDPLYKFIFSIQLILPHPNIINVCSASKTHVPSSIIRPETSPSKCQDPVDQSAETSESLLVALAIQPVSSVAKFVSYSKEKHNFLPEQYEGEVITLLLQLFSGLQHLENNNISLSTVKMENLLLLDSGLPGGGIYLVIDYISLAEREESELVNGTLLSPSIINKTNEFDVGILIYKLLHQPNPFSVKTNLIIRDYKPSDLPKLPIKSRYSHGLQKLAGELLRKNPTDRLSAKQSIELLHLLIWGPSLESLVTAETEGSLDKYLATWHAEECAKMVNYIAEQQINMLLGNGKSFSMADQLHCQFLNGVDFDLMKNSFKLLNS